MQKSYRSYEAYLKCEHDKGYFSGEKSILFKTLDTSSGHSWCFINKEDLVQKVNLYQGFVKVNVLDHNSPSRLLVEINDVGDHRLSRFYVPRSEVVFYLEGVSEQRKKA